MTRTILVVDDEPCSAEMLKWLLEQEGYRVLVANDGQQALDTLSSSTPSLVVSDVMMPVMGGAELCEKMREQPAFRDVPVVLMSAARRRLGLEQGAIQAMLWKPLEIDEVLRTVRRLLSSLEPDAA